MKKNLHLLLFFLLVTGLAVASSLATRALLPESCASCEARVIGLTSTHASMNAHQWVHEHLALTPEQDEKLHPSEERYAKEINHWMEEIHRANMELGQIIVEQKDSSPKVLAAMEKVHGAQQKLQHLTLEHVFEMKNVLSPEQYEKLLKLTADALYQLDCKP